MDEFSEISAREISASFFIGIFESVRIRGSKTSLNEFRALVSREFLRVESTANTDSQEVCLAMFREASRALGDEKSAAYAEDLLIKLLSYPLERGEPDVSSPSETAVIPIREDDTVMDTFANTAGVEVSAMFFLRLMPNLIEAKDRTAFEDFRTLIARGLHQSESSGGLSSRKLWLTMIHESSRALGDEESASLAKKLLMNESD